MSQMFQFHTRVVSGTVGRMPLYSFLFQTQCEVFNFNILHNYNGYKAYTVLIPPHPFSGPGQISLRNRKMHCILHTLQGCGRVWRECRAGRKRIQSWALEAPCPHSGFGVLSFQVPGLWVQVTTR